MLQLASSDWKDLHSSEKKEIEEEDERYRAKNTRIVSNQKKNLE